MNYRVQNYYQARSKKNTNILIIENVVENIMPNATDEWVISTNYQHQESVQGLERKTDIQIIRDLQRTADLFGMHTLQMQTSGAITG